MNVLFLTSYSVSHIIPIKSFIKSLEAHNINVLCMIHSRNTEYCKKNLIPYVEYPDDYWRKKHSLKSQEKDLIIKKYERNNDFIKLYDAFLEKDCIGIYNYHDNVAMFIEEVVANFKPKIIFRDSTDIYWMRLKYKERYKQIKTVGYITNNLYSWEYLMDSYNYRLPIFLGIAKFLPLIKNEYMKDFQQNIERIYKEVAEDLNEQYIRPFYQYDPKEDLNIIFSLDIFQPKYHYRKDILVYPTECDESDIEDNIDEDIKMFCKDSKVIYISTGSFMSREINYYYEILKTINKKAFDYRVIISGGKAANEIAKLIQKMGLEEKVIVKAYIPQLYVLKHSSLFITSGGMNSIKEAIYYKIPMVLFPISSEQRLNGLLIEELNLGISTYKIIEPVLYFENSIDYLLSGSIKQNYNQLDVNFDSSRVLLEIFKRLDIK